MRPRSELKVADLLVGDLVETPDGPGMVAGYVWRGARGPVAQTREQALRHEARGYNIFVLADSGRNYAPYQLEKRQSAPAAGTA